MGEGVRRKKERKGPIKPTEKLPPLHIPLDRALSDKQKAFCRGIIDAILDDETALSFSKPVGELWDIQGLPDYFEKITKPMDLGTVRKRTASSSASAYTQTDSDLFDPNRFREEARLVFLNAILYNTKSSELGRLAIKFIHFIDGELTKLPVPDVQDPDTSQPMDTGKTSDRGRGDTSHPDSDAAAADDDNSGNNGDSDTLKSNLNIISKTQKEDVGDDEKADASILDSDAKSPRKKTDTPEKSAKSGSEDSHKHKSGGNGDGDAIGDGGSGSSGGGNGDGDAEDNDDEGEAKSDPKSDDKDMLDDGDDERPGNGAGDTEMNGGRVDEAERERLDREISTLTKARAKADAIIAEIELEKNVPLTYDENSKLRDEVEALPWEVSQKVVQILRNYVDEALRLCDENDPEFVTLEFSTVEPRLLREIEALIRPDPRIEKEKMAIEQANRGIEIAKRKLKRMADDQGAGNKKKRSKKSR